MAPAAVNAEYSPKLNPRAATGCCKALPKAFTMALLIDKIAGCAYCVCAILSAFFITSDKSYPKTSEARSIVDLYSGSASYKSVPMPACCAPCPLNNNPIFMLNPIYYI